MSHKLEPVIEIAKAIAIKAHTGQTRYDKKTPFIKHPEAVAKHFVLGGWEYPISKTDCECVIVAWLHDVIEDTSISYSDLLKQGIPFYLVAAIEAITKREDESYLNYLFRLSKNNIAALVKLIDLKNNESESPGKHQRDKYILAQHILEKI